MAGMTEPTWPDESSDNTSTVRLSYADRALLQDLVKSNRNLFQLHLVLVLLIIGGTIAAALSLT